MNLSPKDLLASINCYNNMCDNKFIDHGFFQKMAPKSPQIFITFSDTYQCTYAV